MNFLTPEVMFHAAQTLVLLAFGYVGLLIKDAVASVRVEQAQVKADLVAAQTRMQQDMDTKHSENRQGLAVHKAEDVLQFSDVRQRQTELKEMLQRIETKIDRRNAGGD